MSADQADDVALELLERHGEKQAIDQLLTSAIAGVGRTLVIEGPPGLGKTALLNAAAHSASIRHFTVLRASGSELEEELPLGVARKLFEEELAGVTFGRALAQTEHVDRAKLFYDIWHAVSALSDRQPVLLAVDDLHWVDEPSRRLLHFLARRIEDSSVALLLASRPEHHDLGATRFVADLGTPSIQLTPLSAHAVSEMLGISTDTPLLSRAVAATGGNPFLVTQLVSGLAADQYLESLLDLTAGDVADRVGHWLWRQLDRMEPTAAAVAEAVAILGDHAAVGEVASVVGVAEADAIAAATQLEDANIFDARAEFTYRHALVRAAALQRMGSVRQADLHGHVLAMLVDRGAPSERIALHAMRADPTHDARVAAALADTAQKAKAAEDTVNAIRMLQRALAEPPAPEARQPVVLALGAAYLDAGRPTETLRLLQPLADQSEQPALLAEVAAVLAHAYAQSGDVSRALALLDDNADAIAGADMDAALRLRAQAAWMANLDPQCEAELPQRVAGAAELTGRTAGERALLAVAAVCQFNFGVNAKEVCDTALRALGQGRLAADLGERSVPRESSIWLLLYCDEMREARIEIERLAAAIGTANGPRATAEVSTLRGVLNASTGRLSDAESDLTTGLIGWRQGPDDQVARAAIHTVASYLLNVHLVKYGAHAALGTLTSGPFPEVDDEIQYAAEMPFRMSRAAIFLDNGHTDEAVDELLSIRSFMRARGVANPIWAPEHLLAMAFKQTGRHAAAGDLAEEAVEQARAFGTQRLLGRALVTRGKIAATPADGLTDLRDGVDLLSECPDPVMLAEGLLALGTALRVSGHRDDSRASLARGVDIAYETGAWALADRARCELRMLGDRPRRKTFTGREALTASERRIAELAAQGLTNREIAQRLLLTTKTVETHLSSTFRKLGIAGRREIAAALNEPTPLNAPAGAAR